jgi:hypothetical protein
MSGKLRITYGIKGDRKTILMMVQRGSTFADFVNTVRRRNPGLVVNNVWLDGSGIDLEELIEDYHDPEAIFVLSSSGEPLDAAVTQYFYQSRVGGRLGATFSSTAPVTLAPAVTAAASATVGPAKLASLPTGFVDQPHVQITGKSLVDHDDSFV